MWTPLRCPVFRKPTFLLLQLSNMNLPSLPCTAGSDTQKNIYIVPLVQIYSANKKSAKRVTTKVIATQMQISKIRDDKTNFDHKSGESKWILPVFNLNLQLRVFNKMPAKPFDPKSALWLSTSSTCYGSKKNGCCGFPNDDKLMWKSKIIHWSPLMAT